MSAFQQLNKYGEKFTDDIKKAKEDALDMLCELLNEYDIAFE